MGKRLNQFTAETPQVPLSATKPIVLLDLEQFRARLKQFADDTGGRAELGRRLGVTGQYLDKLIAGRRTPGPKLLKAIGARRVTMIEIEVEGPSE